MIPASISRWALPSQDADPATLFTAVPVGDGTYELLFGDGTYGRTTRKGWANLHPIEAGYAYSRGLRDARVIRALAWYGDHQVEALEVLIGRAAELNEGRLLAWWAAGAMGVAS